VLEPIIRPVVFHRPWVVLPTVKVRVVPVMIESPTPSEMPVDAADTNEAAVTRPYASTGTWLKGPPEFEMFVVSIRW
jgi:hypothetical protein